MWSLRGISVLSWPILLILSSGGQLYFPKMAHHIFNSTWSSRILPLPIKRKDWYLLDCGWGTVTILLNGIQWTVDGALWSPVDQNIVAEMLHDSWGEFTGTIQSLPDSLGMVVFEISRHVVREPKLDHKQSPHGEAQGEELSSPPLARTSITHQTCKGTNLSIIPVRIRWASQLTPQSKGKAAPLFPL